MKRHMADTHTTRPTLSTLTHGRLGRREYQSELKQLQLDLMKLQHGLYLQGQRGVIVVEGTDASGKGGMIRRTTEVMDPRGYRVHPIGAPDATELGEHYLQRFWRRLPKTGQLTIFDRSWYGRVLVERVDQLAAPEAWQRAYEEINSFEQQLCNDGIILIKLFLHIDKDEQLSRFKERFECPHKRWKLTPEDFTAREKWEAYQIAFEDMLAKTHRPEAPWKVIGANQKRYARIEAMTHIKAVLAGRIDLARVQVLDPQVEQLALRAFK